MIKQKPNRKVTVRGKQRVNIFQLEKDIKRQHGLQNRINAKQAQLNTNQIITNEEILARLARLDNLERIVLPESAVKKCGVWAWMKGIFSK